MKNEQYFLFDLHEVDNMLKLNSRGAVRWRTVRCVEWWQSSAMAAALAGGMDSFSRYGQWTLSIDFVINLMYMCLCVARIRNDWTSLLDMWMVAFLWNFLCSLNVVVIVLFVYFCSLEIISDCAKIDSLKFY